MGNVVCEGMTIVWCGALWWLSRAPQRVTVTLLLKTETHTAFDHLITVFTTLHMTYFYNLLSTQHCMVLT